MESNQKPFLMIYSVTVHISIRFWCQYVFFFFFFVFLVIYLVTHIFSSFLSICKHFRCYVLRDRPKNSRCIYFLYSELKCSTDLSDDSWFWLSQLLNTPHHHHHHHTYNRHIVCIYWNACIFGCMLNGCETLYIFRTHLYCDILFSVILSFQSINHFSKKLGNKPHHLSSLDKDILLINRHSFVHHCHCCFFSRMESFFSLSSFLQRRFHLWPNIFGEYEMNEWITFTAHPQLDYGIRWCRCFCHSVVMLPSLTFLFHPPPPPSFVLCKFQSKVKQINSQHNGHLTFR